MEYNQLQQLGHYMAQQDMEGDDEDLAEGEDEVEDDEDEDQQQELMNNEHEPEIVN